MKLRPGKKDKRTLWVQVGNRPSEENDRIVGIVDSPEIASRICSTSEDVERLRFEVQRAIEAFESKSTELERLQLMSNRLRDAIRIADEEIKEVVTGMSWGPCQDVMAKHRLDLEQITDTLVKASAIA